MSSSEIVKWFQECSVPCQIEFHNQRLLLISHVNNCWQNSYSIFIINLINFNIDKSWRQNGFRGCHSNQTSVTMADITVRILPALSDNYK